jgi:hypothetical protein
MEIPFSQYSKRIYLIAAIIASIAAFTAIQTDQTANVASGNFSETLNTITGLAANDPQPETAETGTANLQKGLQGYWRFDNPRVSRGFSLEFDGSDDIVDINLSNSREEKSVIYYGWDPLTDSSDTGIQLDVTGVYDSTNCSIYNSSNNEELASKSLGKGDKWTFETDPGLYFRLECDKYTAPYLGDHGWAAKVYYPTVKGDYVGDRFIFRSIESNNDGYTNFYAFEGSTEVTIENLDTGNIQNIQIENNRFRKSSLNADDVYEVNSSKPIIVENTAGNAFEMAPATNGGTKGQEFFGTTSNWDRGAYTIFSYDEPVHVDVYNLSTSGSTLYDSVEISADSSYYKGGVGTKRLRFVSNETISLWIGDTEGGSSTSWLGDDFSFTEIKGGETAKIGAGQHNPNLVISGTEDSTQLNIDGNSYSLEKSETITFSKDPKHVYEVSTDKPVIAQMMAGNNFNDQGSYLIPSFESEIAISSWLKPREISGDNRQWIVEQDNKFMSYIADSDSSLYFRIKSGNSKKTWDTGYDAKTGEWQHIAFTYNGNQVTAFVDGEKINESTKLGRLKPANNISVGGDKFDNYDYYSGNLDDLRIYNNSLSHQKIKRLHEEKPVSRKNLILHQDFNEGPNNCDLTSSTACLSDKSGEGNDGTPNNFDDNDFNTGSGWFNETPVNRPSFKDYSKNNNLGRFYGGNNGELQNFNLNGLSGWTNGIINEYALEFDGQDEEIEASALDKKGAMSVSVWFKLENESSDWQAIVSDNWESFYLGIAPNSGELGWHTRNDSGQSHNAITQDISLNEWHHALGVVNEDADIKKFYVDGVKVGKDSISDFGNLKGKLCIASKCGADFFNGTIDDVRIYNRILSSSEVKSLYQRDSITRGLVGRWNFEAGNQKIAYDTSGLGQQGVLGTSSVTFDGENDIVKVPDASTLDIGEGGWSVSSWVNLEQVNDSWMVIDKGTDEAGTYYLYDASGHGLTWTVKNSTDRFDAGRPSNWYETVDRDRWTHLTGVYNESYVKLYVDGRLYDKSKASRDVGSNSEPLWIGAYQGGSYRLNGSVDEVRIYNRSLSEKEVERLAFR